MNPFRTGLALAVTVALFYTLCTVAWSLAPAQFLWLMNSLFHGLDFSALVQTRTFAWPVFLMPLLVLSVWALCAGAFFAWLGNRLAVSGRGGRP